MRVVCAHLSSDLLGAVFAGTTVSSQGLFGVAGRLQRWFLPLRAAGHILSVQLIGVPSLAGTDGTGGTTLVIPTVGVVDMTTFSLRRRLAAAHPTVRCRHRLHVVPAGPAPPYVNAVTVTPAIL